MAYVAATRARDLLVVPAVGDAEWDGGWTAPLNDAIYPPIRHVGGFRRRRPACPSFKKDSVWRRPDNDPATSTTVCPGLHTFATDGGEGYPVVWWDPHALDLGAEPTLGIRRESLIVKDVDESIVADGAPGLRAVAGRPRGGNRPRLDPGDRGTDCDRVDERRRRAKGRGRGKAGM